MKVRLPLARLMAPLGSLFFELMRRMGLDSAEHPVRSTVARFGLAALVVVNLPLLPFSRKLLEAKRRAGAKLSALMARHAWDFERKWFGELGPGETPLGAIEMSTQADLATAFSQSSKMRWFPYGFRPFLAVAASGLLLPLVPRLLADRQLLEALLRVMTKMF